MPSPQGDIPHAPARWPVIGCWALAALLLATNLSMRTDLVGRHLFDLLGAEENVVYAMIKLLQGGPLYSAPEAVPFDVVQYTPVYYLLLRPVAAVLGIDGSVPHDVYRLIRSVGLVLNLLFGALVFGMARGMGARTPWALLWSAVLLALLPRQVYSRPDTLNLLLFGASMLAFLASQRRDPGADRTRLLDLAVLFGALAPFAKQSGVLALLVIGASLLATRQWKVLFRATGLGAALVASGVALCCWQYGADIFFANVVKGIRNGVNMQEWTWTLLRKNGPDVLIYQLLGLVLAIRLIRSGAHAATALGVGIVLTWAFALLTSMKHGSSQGYYTECLALCLVALAAEGSLWRFPVQRLAPWVLFALALISVRPWQVRWGVAVALGRQAPDEELPAYRQAQAMARLLQEDPQLSSGLVLLTHHDPLENFIVGRSVLTQKDILLLPAAREQYDLQGFHAALDNGAVQWIISTGPVDKLPLVGHRHPALEHHRSVHGYEVYRNTAAADPAGFR